MHRRHVAHNIRCIITLQNLVRLCETLDPEADGQQHRIVGFDDLLPMLPRAFPFLSAAPAANTWTRVHGLKELIPNL